MEGPYPLLSRVNTVVVVLKLLCQDLDFRTSLGPRPTPQSGPGEGPATQGHEGCPGDTGCSEWDQYSPGPVQKKSPTLDPETRTTPRHRVTTGGGFRGDTSSCGDGPSRPQGRVGTPPLVSERDPRTRSSEERGGSVGPPPSLVEPKLTPSAKKKKKKEINFPKGHF